jgi:hypothetical protein
MLGKLRKMHCAASRSQTRIGSGFNKHLGKLLEPDALLDLLSEFGATARR